MKRRRESYPVKWTGAAKLDLVNDDDPDYSKLLVGPYAGLYVEQSGISADLRKLESLYAYDVTQPLGLGTALARTHVRRCLVGEPGATYKYLGLRMFAHPWRDVPKSYECADGLRGIKALDDALKVRCRALGARNCDFTVALINCMDASDAKQGTAVSWHADSCLEDGSTIAVYATGEDWRLGVRVRRDSQGPGRRDKGVNEGDDTPGLSVKLDSGACYYMLDDWNHHHQHAVMAGTGRRLSSTHRVARLESHTASWLEKMLAALPASPQTWSTTSRACDVVEFEWLRQWYIQGEAHARRLEVAWGDFIKRLEVKFADLAARENSRLNALLDAVDPSASARRRKKKRNLITQLGGVAVYDAAIRDVRERATKREQWRERESHSFWDTQPPECRPVPFPSPQEDLRPVVAKLERARAAFAASVE